jgi:hypothetical protein
LRQIVCRSAAELTRAADVIRGLTPDKPWRVQFMPYRAKRSHEQNALLWALYSKIAEGTGYTAEEVHEAMKRKFIPPKFIEIGEEQIAVPGSSAKLDVREFSEFVERVQEFAASELGVVL